MAVRGNGTGENVVNHDSRDGSNQAHGRGQQGFGNTRCDNGQVSGLCLRNTDEAVHNAPDGPEQTNKRGDSTDGRENTVTTRSEEHTSELQSHSDLVCRLLL